MNSSKSPLETCISVNQHPPKPSWNIGNTKLANQSLYQSIGCLSVKQINPQFMTFEEGPLDLEAFPTRSRQIWRLLQMFSGDVVNTFSQTLPPSPKFTIFMGGIGTIPSHSQKSYRMVLLILLCERWFINPMNTLDTILYLRKYHKP